MKVPATSLIETLAAMVIIALTISLGATAFVQNGRARNWEIITKARSEVTYHLAQTTVFNADETLVSRDAAMVIEREVQFEGNLIIVLVVAYSPSGKKLAEARSILPYYEN